MISLLLPATATWGQTVTGRVSGRVQDSSGAVVPGSAIKVTNEGTQRFWTVNTDDKGDYVVPNLPPGMYRVSVVPTSLPKGATLTTPGSVSALAEVANANQQQSAASSAEDSARRPSTKGPLTNGPTTSPVDGYQNWHNTLRLDRSAPEESTRLLQGEFDVMPHQVCGLL